MNTVSVMARRFHVSADTIRHYTKLGLLNPKRDPDNGYRQYRVEDESNLRFVLSAKTLGFSLKEIQKILSVAHDGETPCPLVRKMIERRLIAVREEINNARTLMLEMESAVDHWQDLPDRSSTSESVCHLIDSWIQHSGTHFVSV